MIVDAERQIVGRLASYVAKKALIGEEVIVVNAEKAIISGRKESVLESERGKLRIRNIGNPRRGPFHQKRPDKYLRRSIRGMLPWRKPRGREAFKRVMVYIGIPKEEIKKNHDIDVTEQNILNLKDLRKDVARYVTLGDVCDSMGGKF